MSLEEARDPQTSPERLQALAALGELDYEIAKNPNAPTALLMRLWAKHPRAFEENPIVELLMLESPHFWGSLPVETLKALLTLPSIPAELLTQFAASRVAELRPLVAKHPNTPPEVLHQLVYSYPIDTQRNVAANPNTLLGTLLLLLGNQDQEIARQVAQHPQMPASILDLFRRVGGALPGEQPQIDLTLGSDEMKPLLACGVPVISLVQAHPNLSVEALCALYTEHRFRLGSQFAANPRLPTRYLEEMANPSQGTVSTFLALPLAKNPSATPRVLEGCLRRSDSNIAIAIASRSDLSQELQSRLAQHRDEKVLLALIQNPASAMELIYPLHQKKNWYLRAAFAARADAPLEVLTLLSRDKREGVRVAVAKNPQTPPHLLVWLAQDESDAVKKAASENQSTPAEAHRELERLRSDPEASAELLRRLFAGGAYAKKLVIEHPNLPPEMLYQIASSPDALDRELVARSTKTPTTLLATLAADPSREVRAAAAGNVGTPPSSLDALAREHKSERILLALAENLATPPATLERLFEVRVKGLRERIAKNPSSPTTLLKKILVWLEESPEPQTLRALLQNPSLPSSFWAKLGPKHPRVLWQHPRVQALPLQGAVGYSVIPVRALMAVLRIPEQTEVFLRWAAGHPDAGVRAEVAGHPKTPPRVLHALLGDGEELSILRRLAKNPSSPQAVLAALVRCDDRLIFRRLISNKTTPRALLLWIQGHNPHHLSAEATRALKLRG